MLSFLDAYQGYNQIPLAPEDQEKASFVTDQGVFCYNVMPFGLKNAGATYQRLVNHMFQNQIGRNMEVYIDDMLLNPAKCTFGVRGGRFLGYMISERGIEANPEKINAIMDMSPPKSIREVQKLAEGETLYLYLAISENAVSSVLVRQENREHLPVYYVSKVLQGAEPKYSQIEKLALSLVIAARKLRPYFQSHQVTVLTNHPLKQLLASPKLSGRMVKWAVELSEYGIEFHPRPAIKAQVLADFVVELAYDEASISTPTWSVYVDGSSTSTGSGAGVALESPQGDKFEYAIKLDFPSSNNEAEYEAFLAGCELALAAGGEKDCHL
ncbi:UNVERIFIED_CONTAM: Retrovirus-related Pol polyprotein from transposon opus [Sesamum angustifolium]|uniref:Retrovirus-related Pol polyprotein from transposon opus n=1 Tax=Sesamum angustifolium TaxID=2727405 RepID=A0AAW2INZ9_9LAMI